MREPVGVISYLCGQELFGGSLLTRVAVSSTARFCECPGLVNWRVAGRICFCQCTQECRLGSTARTKCLMLEVELICNAASIISYEAIQALTISYIKPCKAQAQCNWSGL